MSVAVDVLMVAAVNHSVGAFIAKSQLVLEISHVAGRVSGPDYGHCWFAAFGLHKRDWTFCVLVNFALSAHGRANSGRGTEWYRQDPDTI
jgi:hypothetical protein